MNTKLTAIGVVALLACLTWGCRTSGPGVTAGLAPAAGLEDGAPALEFFAASARGPQQVSRVEAAFKHAERDTHLDSLRMLLDADPDLVSARRWDGRTLLITAASMGAQETVRLLLARGADVAARDDAGNTALILVALGMMPLGWEMTDHPGVAELLLEAGADINAANAEGFTALIWAAADPDCSTTMVRLLADNGAAFDVVDAEEGLCPLGWAATQGCLGSIRVLLDHGAPPLNLFEIAIYARDEVTAELLTEALAQRYPDWETMQHIPWGCHSANTPE